MQQGLTETARPPLPALTGLRFFAAFAIVLNHLEPVLFNLSDGVPLLWNFQRLALVGMSLFFVLSGFIIHYNYAQQVSLLQPRALFDFFVARFSRLYPLYVLVLLFDFFASNLFITSDDAGRADYLHLLPYYLTATQSWFYGAVGVHPIPFAFNYSIVSWSISTEFFLYLVFPWLAVLFSRARSVRASGISLAIIIVVSVAFVYFIRKRYSWLDAWGESFLGINPKLPTAPPIVFSNWFSYISPFGRLPEFVTGCALCQFYLAIRPYNPSKLEEMIATLASAAVLLFLAATLSMVAMAHLPYSKDIYWAGMFPIMIITVFLTARYENPFTTILTIPFIVLAGEASYSIYMMHIFFVQAFAVATGTESSQINLLILSVRSVLVCMFILVASLGCYRFYEAPMQKIIRSFLTPRHPLRVFAPVPRQHTITPSANDASRADRDERPSIAKPPINVDA